MKPHAICGRLAAALFSISTVSSPLGAVDLSFYESPGFLRLEAEAGNLVGATLRTDQQSASGGVCVFIDGAGQSVSWSDIELEPGSYRVTLGCKSPWGSEDAPKRVNVSINGQGNVYELPNSSHFSSLKLGDFELGEHNSVSISDNWTWYFIDWIQFVRVDHRDNDGAYSRAARLLKAIKDNQGRKVISGQQNPVDAKYVYEKTGVAPALISEDLGAYDSVSQANYGYPEVSSEDMIRFWEQGFLVSLCWHWHSPSGWSEEGDNHWWNSFYTANTSFDIAGVLANKQGADYALLLADIDRIAFELKKYADADVPVLFRPLHEAEGNRWGAWFWWGADGEEPFKELWRIMYDRLENLHGLRNLIWVYTCTDDMGVNWYPGDEYVDIIGVDEYPDDRKTSLKDAWDRMNAAFGAFGKPLALSEVGGTPDIPLMMDYGVTWAYFASWNSAQYGPMGESDDYLIRVFNSDGLVGAFEMDQNQDGISNAVCAILGLPLQTRFTPALGLDTGGEVVQVDLFTDGSYVHDASLGNLLDAGSGVPVRMGTGFSLLRSDDLIDWIQITPQSYVRGSGDRILMQVPVENAQAGQFFKLGRGRAR